MEALRDDLHQLVFRDVLEARHAEHSCLRRRIRPVVQEVQATFRMVARQLTAHIDLAPSLLERDAQRAHVLLPVMAEADERHTNWQRHRAERRDANCSHNTRMHLR